MADMPSFKPSGDQSLLVRNPIQESFSSQLPNTSRYAWPKPRSESSLSTASFPSRSSKNPFFARHNPHPQRVRHLKGLLDIPVCTVVDQPGVEEDPARFFVSTPTIDQMRQRPLKGLRMPINANAYVVTKERAIPSIGMVPITQTWREELTRLTEAAGLKSKSQYTNTSAYQVPMSRQGSRQADKPPPSRNGEVPPSRSGRLESRAGDKPPASRQGVRIEERPMQHIVSYPDREGVVLELLGQILQTDSLLAIQTWLANAPDREKEIVLDMIRAVSTSDREFREGYNEVVRSPTSYEDQLLQQEASLDVDGIKKYNEERKKEKDDEEDKKKQQQAEEAKPRTPRSAAAQNFTQYQWTSPNLKPSSPFIVSEKKKEAVIDQLRPRPGTAEAEIEEIRSRLQSRSTPRVFSHQRPGASRLSQRPQTQQSLYVPPADALDPVAQRPPSHQSIKSQQSVIKSILSYKPGQN